MEKLNHTNILGSFISVLDLNETCDEFVKLSKTNQSHYICVSNVHTVVTGIEDPSYAKVTNEATLATADGVPLIWASKLLSKSNSIHGRASGPDILIEFIKNKKYSEIKHYFYGSTPAVIEQLKKSLSTMNPNFKAVGFYSPPFRNTPKVNDILSDEELNELKNINESQTDIIWIGLGAPKQEIWMARARPHLNRGVLVGAGAAFDFISGNKKRAPNWMQKAGLEWAFRLLSEPKRLTKRYLDTNPKFVLEVFKALIAK